jgi:hypothetical protein
MKNKAFLLIIVVIFGLFLCTSCSKNREYDETEVITAANDLIRKSEKLNDIYYGRGIDYIKDESMANGTYYPAELTSIQKFGIETINDLKNLTVECFTKEYSDLIMRTKLSSVSDDDGIQEYSRYYQKYNALDNSEECIMVRKDALVNLTDTVIYDYSSLHVSRVKKDEVFVKISATVITDDGKTQVQEIEISLLEEESGWRINSPTYVRYFDRQQYEDLQKNK